MTKQLPAKILAKEKPSDHPKYYDNKKVIRVEIPDYKKDDSKSFEEIMRAYGKI